MLGCLTKAVSQAPLDFHRPVLLSQPSTTLSTLRLLEKAGTHHWPKDDYLLDEFIITC